MRSSKMFKTITSFALVAAMVAPTMVSPATADAAKKPSFSTKSVKLATGASKKVSVKNGAKKAKYSWKSSSKCVSIKAKKKNATITAKSAGTAKITCVVKKGKRSTTVSGLTVKTYQAVKTFTMQDSSSKACSSTTLAPGSKTVLKAAINNNAAGSTTNQKITWSSNNTKIAKVTKKNVNSATVTAVANGTATITAKEANSGKTVTCTVKVEGKSTGTTNTAKATEAPKSTPLPKGVIYQQKYDVTRWYDGATASQSENKHAHDGYNYNSFAIWMIGFFDNKYSTNEKEYMAYGPDLTKVKNAEFTSDKGQDFRGYKPIHLTGEFSYDGTNQKTILLQINYTKPSDYPIIWKWEKGASKTGTGKKYVDELSINTDKNGSEALDAKTTAKVDVKFTIPKDAVNGDVDEETGQNFGIYLYFPNKPGGALIYNDSNTFHFKNFKMTY